MKVTFNQLSKVLAIALMGVLSLNTASAAGNYSSQQYAQKKAQKAVKRINNQLPQHAKLKKHQKQRIRGIVKKHQQRLTPLKKSLKHTNRLLRHQQLNRHKNAYQIKQLRIKKRHISKRIKKVRRHQVSQVNKVLNKQQRRYIKNRQHARQQWQQKHHYR